MLLLINQEQLAEVQSTEGKKMSVEKVVIYLMQQWVLKEGAELFNPNELILTLPELQ